MAGNLAYLIIGIVAGALLAYWLAYYVIGLLPLLLIAAVMTGADIVWVNRR